MRTRSRSRLSALALCFLSSLYLAESQAPGDGDPTCLARNNHPHPEHVLYVGHLMDTRDYLQLLRFDGKDTTWQALDKDENNIMGGQTQVKTYRWGEKFCSAKLSRIIFSMKSCKKHLSSLFDVAISLYYNVCALSFFYSGSTKVGLVHQHHLSVDMTMALKIIGWLHSTLIDKNQCLINSSK